VSRDQTSRRCSPAIAEVIGHSGAFDYIELCGEYASWDLTSLEHFARAVELFPHMSSMMKVEQEPRTFIATRALDAGIQNMLFSDCRSVAEVEECIKAVMPATPENQGLHGCALRRSVGYVVEFGSEAWAEAQKKVVIAIMIEKRGAMEQLEQILSIDRVDMVQFGPCDYSINIGKTGEWNSSEVRDAQRDIYRFDTIIAQPR
jgi:2-keto-3-deoxy-L-rhamnonate aldolase RhmA